MRFAISTSPHNCTWDWLCEMWDAADRHDIFESGWTFDHFYPIFSDPTGDCLEGWITLTALLARTHRIRGGVLVTGMVYRHPAVLANMASTLDIASGGRLELGLGAGWNEEECHAYGIELGDMSTRFDRFEEGLAVVSGLVNEDRTDFEGRHFTLTAAMNNPKGPQQPLPVCIGGVGEKRTLPLAARYADHWNYPPATPTVEEFARKREVLHAACRDIGRDPAEITSSLLIRPDADGFDGISRRAVEFAGAGCDLFIVSLPKDEGARYVDDLARALG